MLLIELKFVNNFIDHYEYATTTLMAWLIGGSIECLGGCYKASVGLAVAAVWESPI